MLDAQQQVAGDSFREVSKTDHTHKQHRHCRRRTSKSRLNSAQVRARLRSSESGSMGYSVCDTPSFTSLHTDDVQRQSIGQECLHATGLPDAQEFQSAVV